MKYLLYSESFSSEYDGASSVTYCSCEDGHLNSLSYIEFHLVSVRRCQSFKECRLGSMDEFY